MGASSPPPAPDPVKTAQAQTQSNKETAIANYGLAATNQTDAAGNKLTYNQIGTWADGTPRYEATQTYSPTNQALFNTNQQTQQNLANIGNEQSSRIQGLLGTNLNLGDNERAGKLADMARMRLDPQWQQNEDALRTRLANQGLSAGSAAWDAEMRRFGQNRNDAYTANELAARNTINQEISAERNAPINEITALMSGSQVTPYSGAATPKVTQANTDVAGITNSAYQNQLAAWNAEQQSSRGLMGGLFSLGGTLGSAFLMSDERMKEDKRKVGELDNGLPVYEYRYKGDDTPQIGLMAQDVKKVHPDAVKTTPSGLMAVNYHEAVKGKRHG